MQINVLYLGLTPPDDLSQAEHINLIHYPVIRIIPRPASCLMLQEAFRKLPMATHLLFTSKTAVHLFFEYFPVLAPQSLKLSEICIVAVGKATAKECAKHDITVHITAERESSEGVVEELSKQDLKLSHIFWPHSALSRTVITDFFQEKSIAYHDCILYNTVEYCQDPKPDLATVHEIVFTSPSTVDAFLRIFGKIPTDKTITPIGEITARHLMLASSGMHVIDL